jgi:hypothetical protein
MTVGERREVEGMQGKGDALKRMAGGKASLESAGSTPATGKYNTAVTVLKRGFAFMIRG